MSEQTEYAIRWMKNKSFLNGQRHNPPPLTAEQLKATASCQEKSNLNPIDSNEALINKYGE